MNSLKSLLEEKKCFKLICGAGNENLEEVEKLVALYSKAGCHFFDLAANEDVLKAAQRGLDFSIPTKEQKDYHFCISIGTKGDQHMQKAKIDRAKCKGCEKCIEVCPQGAVKRVRGQEGTMISIEIVEKYCIGCSKCAKICPQGLIELTKESPKACLPAFLPSCSLSCIELHASDTNENEVDEIWQDLNENFDGILSLCIGRIKLSDEKFLNRLKRLLKIRRPYTTIIQADGVSMTGDADNFETTLPAVLMGEFIQNTNLPIYLMLSGGTNPKTAELAKLHGLNLNGIAMGSYARKIVKKYIECENFLENKIIFNEAVKIASKLIQSTIY